MRRKDLVIIGAGGFGREVLWQLNEVNDLAEKYNVIGFIDDYPPDTHGILLEGHRVLGSVQWLAEFTEDICALIAVGSPKARKSIYDRIKINPRISFPSFVAEDVKYSESVKFGQGCIICLSNILTVNITLGDFVIANLDCTIGHNAVLGDFVTLYPSVNVSGNVCIGEFAEVGTGANIIQGINIGKNSIIGAGSVAIKDIPANCTAVGIPAAPIKFH